MSAALSAIESRTTDVLRLFMSTAQSDANLQFMSALAALLRSSVASTSTSLDLLGLTTAMLLDGLGLSNDEYYYDAFRQCLIQVRRRTAARRHRTPAA